MTKDKENEHNERAVEILPFRYDPIKPDADFDKKEFMKAQGELNHLEGLMGALEKDPSNPNTKKNLSSLLWGDPEHAARHSKTDSEVRNEVNEALDDGVNKMAKYAENHFYDLIGEVKGKNLRELLVSTPHYKKENDETHNKIISALKTTKNLENVARENDIEKIRKTVSDVINSKSSKLPDWAKKIAKTYMHKDQFVAEMFSVELKKNAHIWEKELAKDGNFDEEKARKMIKYSVDKARDKYNDAAEDDKKNIHKKELKPIYLATAKYAHG